MGDYGVWKAEQAEAWKKEADRLQAANTIMIAALNDILNASRDAGLSEMCNWMRGRAGAAFDELEVLKRGG